MYLFIFCHPNASLILTTIKKEASLHISQNLRVRKILNQNRPSLGFIWFALKDPREKERKRARRSNRKVSWNLQFHPLVETGWLRT